jgi:hypothetical protein
MGGEEREQALVLWTRKGKRAFDGQYGERPPID